MRIFFAISLLASTVLAGIAAAQAMPIAPLQQEQSAAVI